MNESGIPRIAYCVVVLWIEIARWQENPHFGSTKHTYRLKLLVSEWHPELQKAGSFCTRIQPAPAGEKIRPNPRRDQLREHRQTLFEPEIYVGASQIKALLQNEVQLPGFSTAFCVEWCSGIGGPTPPGWCNPRQVQPGGEKRPHGGADMAWTCHGLAGGAAADLVPGGNGRYLYHCTTTRFTPYCSSTLPGSVNPESGPLDPLERGPTGQGRAGRAVMPQGGKSCYSGTGTAHFPQALESRRRIQAGSWRMQSCKQPNTDAADMYPTCTLFEELD